MRFKASTTLPLTDDSVCSTVGIVALLPGVYIAGSPCRFRGGHGGPVASSGGHHISALSLVWQTLRDASFETLNDGRVKFWHQPQPRVMLHGGRVSGSVDCLGAELLQEGHNAFFLLPYDPLLLPGPIFQVLREVVRQRAGTEDRIDLGGFLSHLDRLINVLVLTHFARASPFADKLPALGIQLADIADDPGWPA